MKKEHCPICGEKAKIPSALQGEVEVDGQKFCMVAEGLVECHGCGSYLIDTSLFETIEEARQIGEPPPDPDLILPCGGEKYAGKLHLIAGLTKTHWVRTGEPLRLTQRHLDDQLASAQVPKTPAQCVDKLVLHLKYCSPYFGAERMLRIPFDWPLAFARGSDEFRNFFNQIEKDGHAVIGVFGSGREECRRFNLTMEGWRRAEELERTSAHSSQAFVATWFDDKMDSAYRDGFQLALEDTGWEPLWLKLTKDCGKIDDQITAGIMQSGLVVADFTGHRASVYFEAGFAKGLGVPVILTCREDDKGSEDAGFDTEHYRHIFWKEPADLRSKLVEFIGAMGLDRTKPLPPRMREEL